MHESTCQAANTLIQDTEAGSILSYAFSISNVKIQCLLGARRQDQPLPTGLETDLRIQRRGEEQIFSLGPEPQE